MQALDPRIIKVTLDINGTRKVFSSPLAITATGNRYANALQNECEVTIYNLDKATQDYIVTETSPYNLNRTPKTVTIEAGRESYGTALIYVGNIVTSIVSQPPDIGLTLKCLTGNFIKGNILAVNYAGGASFKQVSQGVAQNTNTLLNFQGPDKTISNYSFAGAALKQVELLGAMGGVNAFIDNNVLVVKGAFVPLSGVEVTVNSQTGMIGIPEFTEQGIRVKYLLDAKSTLGALLHIKSYEYPAANGDYVIYKLGFQIASRDVPFYYIADAARIR